MMIEKYVMVLFAEVFKPIHPKSICQFAFIRLYSGDFNDTPSSYAYHTILGDLKMLLWSLVVDWEEIYIGEFPLIVSIIYSMTPSLNLFHIKLIQKTFNHHPISARIQN